MRIGFVGRTCSGKDTRADSLEPMMVNPLRLAFSIPVKTQLAHELGISVFEVERRKGEFRSDLQRIGEEGRPWKWVDTIEEAIEEYPHDIIITDVRYQNEIDMLHDYGFTIIRLTASKPEIQLRYLNKFGRELTEEQWNHPSEQIEELENIDIEWDATEDPYVQVASFVTSYHLNKLRNQFKEILTVFKK